MFVIVTLFLPRGIMGLWHDLLGLLWNALVKPRLVTDAGRGEAATDPSQPSSHTINREVVASA